MSKQRSIDNPEALFRKLERSFYRREAYGDNPIDWVFDVAVTAWHLVDWVARERSGHQAPAVQATQDQLKARCAELAVCEQVCNGAKHFILGNPKLAPFSVAGDVRATDDRIGISRDVVPGVESVDVILTPLVRITDRDGQTWEAIDLFHKVLAFWRAELGLGNS